MATSYKSNFLDNAILNYILNGTALPSGISNTTIYIALWTTQPLADGTGGVEVAAGDYARAAITVGTAQFAVTTTESAPNVLPISFTTPTSTWGTVVACSIMNDLTASAANNFLYIGALTTPFAISSGTITVFAPSGLTVKEQ